MVGLALSAETTVDAPPAAVFNLFGAGAGAGWVFDAVCERVAIGSVVTLHAPLGGSGVDLLGRISAVRPPRRSRSGTTSRGGVGCGCCSLPAPTCGRRTCG